MKNKKSGFTLIELLVVVLIIGILSAIALPQYEKAVEKARITEAMILMRAIRDAQLLYYLENDEYAAHNEIDKLVIDVPGKAAGIDSERLETKYFVYAPNDYYGRTLAYVYRVNSGNVTSIDDSAYVLSILQSDPEKIVCEVMSEEKATNVQKKLCQEINNKGSW